MKKIGWSMLAVAFATAILSAFTGRNTAILGLFGLTFIIGLVALSADLAIRIYRRQLILRPYDAAKKVFPVFFVILFIRAAMWFVFPSAERDIAKELFMGAALAVVYSIYSTSYRRTA